METIAANHMILAAHNPVAVLGTHTEAPISNKALQIDKICNKEAEDPMITNNQTLEEVKHHYKEVRIRNEVAALNTDNSSIIRINRPVSKVEEATVPPISPTNQNTVKVDNVEEEIFERRLNRNLPAIHANKAIKNKLGLMDRTMRISLSMDMDNMEVTGGPRMANNNHVVNNDNPAPNRI